jgi:hypothetical protein
MSACPREGGGGPEMRRKGNFVRYTADELQKLKSETDWAKVDATTREEIEQQAQADDRPLPEE